MERRAYRITGAVQGVGFRWWVREAAVHLGLHGSVRNEADGSVSVEAEGPGDAMDRLESHLRDGPPASRVEQLVRLAPPQHPLPHPFQIRR